MHLLESDPLIDTIILGCTHYPLLEEKIRKYLPDGIALVAQGPLVADRLSDYLLRHAEIDGRLSKNGACRLMTTEAKEKFAETASLFFNHSVHVEQISM